MYVFTADLNTNGTLKTGVPHEPLVLRANAGDCIEVMLRNKLPATLVDPDDPESFRKALKPNTKAIFSETLGNPAINVIDIAAVGAIAREAGVPFGLAQMQPILREIPVAQCRLILDSEDRDPFGHDDETPEGLRGAHSSSSASSASRGFLYGSASPAYCAPADCAATASSASRALASSSSIC